MAVRTDSLKLPWKPAGEARLAKSAAFLNLRLKRVTGHSSHRISSHQSDLNPSGPFRNLNQAPQAPSRSRNQRLCRREDRRKEQSQAMWVRRLRGQPPSE